MKSTAGCCPSQALGVDVAAPIGLRRDGGAQPKTVRPLSLRRNCSWIVTGNVVNMGCQWGRVVLLVHLAGVEKVGMVVLAFAISTPVNVLAYLGLRGTVATDTKEEYRFGDYLALRLITATLAMLVVAAIALASPYEAETAMVILIVAAGELFRSISDIFHALFQQHERMDRMAISIMIRGLLMLGLLALGICLTGSVLWGMLGFPLAMAVTFFGFDLPTGARMVYASPRTETKASYDTTRPGGELRPRWNARTLVRLTWLTLPLGIAMMMISLAQSIPRYVVGHLLGLTTLGVFVMVLYLALVGAKLVAAVSQSAGPRLARHYAAGNSTAYCRLLGKLLALTAAMGVAVVLGVAVFGGPILGLLYGAEFRQYAGLAVYLMAAGTMMYLTTPLAQAVDAMRRFKTHLVMRVLGIVTLLVLLPGLIAAYGLEGAAAAMFIGYLVTILGLAGAILTAIRTPQGGDSAAATVGVPAARAA
ncbi:MAG TPA: hypothetical protein VMY42_02600 [Thermoguttaceae bacterium]|nr:hypothetical protein [Thermoguttaceae bacterium]